MSTNLLPAPKNGGDAKGNAGPLGAGAGLAKLTALPLGPWNRAAASNVLQKTKTQFNYQKEIQMRSSHQETKMPANKRSVSVALARVIFSACPGRQRNLAMVALAVAAALFASPVGANDIIVYSSLPSSFSISEGDTVSANWSAVATGSDYLGGWTGWSTTFGGGNYGANTFSGGNTYYNPGTFSISASVSADFYYYGGFFGTTRYDYPASGTSSSFVTVANVAPSIQSLPGNFSVNAGDPVNFYAGAFDPGTAGGEVLTYAWDLNADGNYADYIGASGSTSFATPGSHYLSVDVSDGNGGNTVAGFTVTVIPEPTSLALLGLGIIGLLARRKANPATPRPAAPPCAPRATSNLQSVGTPHKG